MDALKRTPLYDLHVALGARMVPFAGWEMPVQYPLGVLGEHLHTRKAAGLFDVSHMGQVILGARDAAARLEGLVLALQGPAAEAALARLMPEVADMRFMDVRDLAWEGETLWVSRSGYTGEDGFEISVPEARAEAFARALLDQPEVEAIGLGARDSLRLEAGLPLYGHDMDEGVSPARAGLGWSIPKVRRAGGERAGGFPGAEAVLAELGRAPTTRRGLRPEGRAPIREGVELYADAEGGAPIGRVTSGGFGPSLGAPVAMASLPADLPEGATVFAELRGRRIPATLVPMPFVSPTYKR